MTIGDRIRIKREEMGLSQEMLAYHLGLKDRSSIAKIEKSKDDVSLKNVERIAGVLQCSISYLMGWDKLNQVPVLGRVTAGIPIEAIQDIIDYEEVDDRLASLGELFGLKIKGDSMTPRICDGDVVIVHRQSYAENGDTIIATLNGDDAVCKKLYIYGKTYLLRSTNPAYEDIDVSNRGDFSIIGKVVELRAKF